MLLGANMNRVISSTQRLQTMTEPRARSKPAVSGRIGFALGKCSMGAILVALSKKGVCAILLGDTSEALILDLQDRFPQTELIIDDSEREQWIVQVVNFIEAPMLELDLPMDIRGTEFQRKVWQALRQIPIGQTASYTDIAQRIGAPKAVRAVASACAANRLAVAIPCHRVVRLNGNLSGYRWGIERKAELLRRESTV